MFRVDLVRLFDQQEQMKTNEQKMTGLAEEFDRIMAETGRIIRIDGISEIRSKINRRLEEHQEGLLQMKNAALRAGQIYQERERRIEENCEGGEDNPHQSLLSMADLLFLDLEDQRLAGSDGVLPDMFERISRIAGDLENPFEEEV